MSASYSIVFTDAYHSKLNGIESGSTADQTKSDIDSLNINADTVDNLHASSFLRSDANDGFTGTLTGSSDSTNPVIKIAGGGPNFIRFDSNDESSDTIDLIYRTSPNTLAFERASDAQIMFSVDADDQQALFAGNLDVGQGLDVTGNITVSGTVDGADVAAMNSKLSGIEAGATADQTAAEILTAIKTVDGSGSGLDADTLDGAQPSVSASNNTIVKRHSSGYIFANYFNTTPNDVSSGITKVCVETGNDGYIRHGTAAGVRSFLNVENGATADQTASEIVALISGQTIAPSVITTTNLTLDFGSIA